MTEPQPQIPDWARYHGGSSIRLYGPSFRQRMQRAETLEELEGVRRQLSQAKGLTLPTLRKIKLAYDARRRELRRRALVIA